MKCLRTAALGMVLIGGLHGTWASAAAPPGAPPPAQTAPAIASPSPAPVPASSQTPAATLATTPAAVDAAGRQYLASLQANQRASEDRLRQAIVDSKPSGWEKLWPAILGLIGVLVGGAINVWVQRWQRAASEQAHRATAAFEAQTKIIDYRSRQAHEFYQPLWLMLQRSSGVRAQLCDHLAKKDPVRFRLEKEPGDQREHLFVYGPNGEPRVRFRLIEAMHELATQHSEILPLVDEIVAIGEKMSALIHDRGGLVVSSQTVLADLLGRYLAHFSILREVAAKASDPSKLQGITYNVLYPVEMNRELKNGIAFLQDTLEKWSTFSANLWDQAMPGNPMPSMAILESTPAHEASQVNPP
ncbi:hypothetical protein LL974_03850 [Xanthomonas campestris pv. cannae]|nr:hypothetical protein [Xanthomonas campestris pv. cannae]